MRCPLIHQPEGVHDRLDYMRSVQRQGCLAIPHLLDDAAGMRFDPIYRRTVQNLTPMPCRPGRPFQLSGPAARPGGNEVPYVTHKGISPWRWPSERVMKLSASLNTADHAHVIQAAAIHDHERPWSADIWFRQAPGGLLRKFQSPIRPDHDVEATEITGAKRTSGCNGVHRVRSQRTRQVAQPLDVVRGAINGGLGVDKKR